MSGGRAGNQNQQRPAFPHDGFHPHSTSPPDDKGLERRTPEEGVDNESGGGLRSGRFDGRVSVSARRGGGISLEAGLHSNDAGRSDEASRGGRLAVLGYEDDVTPPHPRSNDDAGAADGTAGKNNGDSGGGGVTGESHHVGEARVAAEALVRTGGEQRTAGGAGAGGEGGEAEASVRRSVLPALRLDNGTLVMGDRVGLRSLPPYPEREEDLNRDGDAATNGSDATGADGNAVGGGKMGTGDTEETAGTRIRKKKSLEEWATAARKRGRVDVPVPTTLPPSTRDHSAPGGARGNGSSKYSSRNKITSSILLTPHDLKSARARAHKALLAGNVTDTLEMCQQILQEWPHDGSALLYQGAAMAQRGEWDVAWNRMERVLALSRGVDEIPMSTATLGTAGYPVDDDDSARGSAHDSARLDAAAKPSVAAEAEVPLDIALAAAANLASFARSRARETLDPNAETFFLVEGLLGNTGLHRAGPRRRITGNRSSTATSPSNRDTAGDDEGSNGRGYYEVERIDGYTDLLVMMAQALEGKGQLTSALRLYQRAVLLGSHRDQRALHGIGGLSRRLLEVERERTRRRGTTGGAASPTHSSILSPLSLPNTPTGETTTTSSTGAPGAVALSRRTLRREPGASCEWGISHPRPGQVFSPEDSIQVEYDLTLLDPGLPLAGSLFETFAIRAAAGGSFSAKDVQENGGSGRIVQGGLGVVVCSYLEGFKAAHCLPRGQLRDVGLGWHLLTAEAYQLPSLAPFSCSASAGDDSAGYRCGLKHACMTYRLPTTCWVTSRLSAAITAGLPSSDHCRPSKSTASPFTIVQ